MARRHALPKVFYNPYKFPPRQSWKISCSLQRQEAGTLLERLHFLVAEKQGVSFYYPEPNGHRNTCRFEWNRKHKGDRFGLRVGLSITVEQEIVGDVELYVSTRELAEDDFGNAPAFSSKLIASINKEVIGLLNKAARIDTTETKQEWRCGFLIEIPYQFGFEADKEAANGRFRFLRTRRYQSDHKQVTVLIVKATSENKPMAKAAASRYAMIALALLTLSEKRRFELSSLLKKGVEAFPNTKNINEDSFYPKRRFWFYEEATGEGVTERFELLWNAFEVMSTYDQECYTRALLAYYGATNKDSNNSTLSVIGHMAALASLAKYLKIKCTGKITCSKCGKLSWPHDAISEKAAMAKLIIETCNIEDKAQCAEINKLVKRVHSEQRSAFVHAATLRHEEYSQGLGVPPASPTNSSATQDVFTYQNDLLSISMLTCRTLIEWLFRKAGINIDHKMMNITTELVGFKHDCAIAATISSRYQTMIALR